MKIDFKEWLLTEIGHVKLEQTSFLALPDEYGRKQWVEVAYCDPMFETYNAVGRRYDAATRQTRFFTWKEMINMNPRPGRNGEPAGIGWEGALPFTGEKGLFFGCSVRDHYATIGPSRNLIEAPSDWYRHALFTNHNGVVTYFVPGGTFGPQQPARAF